MKKRLLALFLTLGLVCTVLTACGDGSKGQGGQGNNGGEAVSGGEITVGIAKDLDDSLDPHRMVTAGTREVLFNLFEGLVKPNSKGELIPAVAERYQLSEDGRTYTFTLREGVKFHNGATVTAEDVVYSIERCADTSEGTPLVPAFSVIQEVKAVDEKTVTITIAQRDLEFISYLTSAIIPKGYDDQATHPVGTGPFMYVSRSPQENFVIQRFDDYWGEKPDLTKVTYKIIENADSILLSLQSGAVDVFAHLTTTQIQQLGDGFHVEEGTMNLVQALYLNNAEKPFDDVRVRQALCYAIDRQQILDLAFDGYGTLLGSSMYPAFSKYFDDELTNYYTYNTEKAKELLTEAGYPNGFDMTITVPSNYQSHMDTAQVIVEQLKAVGINAAIQPVTWESWVQDTYSNRQFQSTVVGVDASNMTARAMLERFVSTASRDFINYNNADYDALFAQAQACYDDEEQTAIYRAMEKNLAENAANVYIQDMADFVAVRDGLEGPSFYPIYVLDLSTIHYTK